MNNINLQIYSFGFDCGLSFLDKIRKAAELGIDKVNIFTEILDFGKKFTLENLPDMTFLQYSKALADAMTEVVKYRMEVFTCGRTL